MRPVPLLAVIVLLQSPLTAQRPDSLAITTAELGARLRFFSTDLFEGRYPGTRGEALTTAYLISELTSFGVHPGAAEGWLQAVAIVTHQPVPNSAAEIRVSGRVTRTLEHGRDIRLANYGATPDVATGGELVFVGYGIDAPIYKWNDFAGVDLRGKIAVVLVGEPSIPGDSVRFNGSRASRFSWNLAKIAEIERRGAVGLVFLRPAGSFPNSPPTGLRRLAGQAAGLKFTGTITDSAFATLLPPRSPALGALLAAAGRPGFRALPLGVRLDVRFQTKPVTVTTHNVIGVVPGSDAALAGEHVVISAHWDAYGVGRAVNGDSIYNGALDDGSGVTALLALARVFAQHPQRRSITILFTTAEEWGLLGAEAFVCGGPIPPDRIAANLNLDDGLELLGIKRDAAPLGVELSTLGRTVDDVARRKGLRVSPDPFPTEGFFLRADNFPFARAGVPALYMALGTDAEGHPAGWADSLAKVYLTRDYHAPSDAYDTVVMDLRGSQQFAEFVRDVTIAVANAAERPEWVAGSEFTRAQAATGCGARL
jgi:Zn-dependent M28 family amino/carboxypeptidase